MELPLSEALLIITKKIDLIKCCIIIYLLAVRHQQKNYNNVRETNKKRTQKNHVYRLVVF